MAEFSKDRRDVIKTLGLALASALLLWRYLTPVKVPVQAVTLRIPLADIPVDGAYVDKDERVAVIRDKVAIYALSLVCTHLGCTVTAIGDGFSCPCHGSRFDRNGKVLRGPADRGLAMLKVIEKGGMVEVSGS